MSGCCPTTCGPLRRPWRLGARVGTGLVRFGAAYCLVSSLSPRTTAGPHSRPPEEHQ
jgi:hypothetical protein